MRYKGETPLHYAARGRRPQIINFLLDEGMHVDTKNTLVSTYILSHQMEVGAAFPLPINPLFVPFSLGLDVSAHCGSSGFWRHY